MKPGLDMKTQMTCDNKLIGYQQPLCAYVYFKKFKISWNEKGFF
jgi:hypothetical protein